jgi:hypothetical protein
MAFVLNSEVNALLEKEGTEVLPVIFLDGKIYIKGRYLNHDERPAFFRAALGKTEEAA